VSDRVFADYLIIGSGIAGLRAAVALAPFGRVVILTKSDPGAGSTGYAQGGIAAAVGEDDSPARHLADTIAAGDGLSDQEAARVLVEEGPHYVQELIDWGARFDREPDGRLALAREGAHSVRRVLHARDATGREIGRTLFQQLRHHPSVTVVDHALAIGTIVEAGVVAGARFVNQEGRLCEARAMATLLATGGAGQVYRETTNPPVATGDGMAIAYLAGARVADLEFVQFHPTALSVAGAPRFLLSEALRGEGALLINASGERFMPRYDPAGELAPRDRVARAIVLEAARTGGPVYLTMSHLPASEVHERFPLITASCREAGLDLATDPIPVAPAAHYVMGGVSTDVDGRTSLPGLFAAGEVACTGLHGANRLASNSLLEGLVFGARAGAAMTRWQASDWPDPTPTAKGAPESPSPNAGFVLGEAELKDLMWTSVGIFRDRDRLQRALSRLDPMWHALLGADPDQRGLNPSSWRMLSLVTVGRLIARAAVRREESRGGHSRTDFPERDDVHFRRHIAEVRS
jgi:L-aspartate oxidase